MVIRVDTGTEEARADEVEEVWFGDDGPYEFYTPKVAPLIGAMRRAKMTHDEEEQGMIAMEAQEKWLKKGFGPDQWDRLQKRLDDEDDILDWVHLIDVFDKLFAAVTGRPPTSSGGFSGTSSTKPSGANVSPLGLTRTS